MRVTQKGQVTIPKHVRDRLGIKPGSEVEFVAANDHAKLTLDAKPAKERGRREQIEFALKKHAGTFDTGGMDGKAYIDWLRGPREDVLPD